MSESVFKDSLAKGGALSQALYNLEFAMRYEVYQNVAMEDLVESDRHTDLFKTQAWTIGVNYYIQKNNAKIQANYIFVDDPSSSSELRGLREVRNDIFVVNFQIGF
jgi:phosphate-selective porin